MAKSRLSKPLLLTFDYELFFGIDSGSVEKSLIEPVKKLLNILDEKGIKATFFIDTMFILTLKINMHSNSVLKAEYSKVVQQIRDVVSRGHDVQMHVHAHWLDAKYIKKFERWIFTYEKYRLHSLKNIENVDNEWTIEACISQSKKLLEDICRPVSKTYKVFCFRAGGWCLQPFSDLSESLKKNGVICDSSVVPFMFSKSGAHFFDYRNSVLASRWKFSDDVLISDPDGCFVEIPIATSRIRNWRLLRNYIVKRITRGWGTFGDGIGMKFEVDYFHKVKMILKPFSYQVKYLDLDFYIYQDLLYMIHQVDTKILDEGPIVLLGHPKNFSNSSLQNLKKLVNRRDIDFVNSYLTYI